MIISLIIFVLAIVSMWKVFTKAGKPGWASIVPIYNIIVLIQIAKKPEWWVLLFFVPVVNLVVYIIMNIEISKRFGKDTGFAVGLILLPFIFLLILGLGDAKYISDDNINSQCA